MTQGIYDRLSARHKWQAICTNVTSQRHESFIFCGQLNNLGRWKKLGDYPDYQIAIIDVDNPDCNPLPANIICREVYHIKDLISILK